jgi:hypothetical protein
VTEKEARREVQSALLTIEKHHEQWRSTISANSPADDERTRDLAAGKPEGMKLRLAVSADLETWFRLGTLGAQAPRPTAVRQANGPQLSFQLNQSPGLASF